MIIRLVRLGVLASGTRTGGGSGFENLVSYARAGNMLGVEIAAVGSNIFGGGVYERARRLDVPFHFFNRRRPEAADYEKFVKIYRLNYVALSGYLLPIEGLDPAKTFNIHPGPLPEFGGITMYGHYVHEAVMDAYRRGEILESAVSMHFVTADYDAGPVFFTIPVPIAFKDNAETLQARVNQCEHIWQPWVTQLVVAGQIHWDGWAPATLKVPEWYRYLRKAR